MSTDEHHDNSYEDTGEVSSRMAHIAYADWRGPELERRATPRTTPVTHNPVTPEEAWRITRQRSLR